jgi:hypothetical protein
MRTTGSAPVFQVPRRGRPSARVWVTVLLCAAVPPLGLIVLWRGLRCPVRGKVLISALALLSMTLMLTTYISFRENSGILIPQQAAGQFEVNDYTSSAGSSVSVTSASQSAAPAATPAPEQPEMTPAPANPFE